MLPGGTLDVGTQANPIAANVTALIETANQTINTTFDPSQYGDSLIGLGNVTIYGAAKTPFVQLAVAPQAGATTLVLGSAGHRLASRRRAVPSRYQAARLQRQSCERQLRARTGNRDHRQHFPQRIGRDAHEPRFSTATRGRPTVTAI